MKTLYDELKDYADSDYYGFHMPGHKRNGNVTGAALPYELDITEIEGFDDLHHAKGILKQAQERAAKVFHAEESCFLVNGSTAGILSAILGCTQQGDRILMARNCHKSVYHAVQMNELKPLYLYPEFYKEQELNGAIDPEEVQKFLAQDAADTGEANIRAVVITSPTYDGIVSDIEQIAQAVHAYKIPLIVDEAHGAHFGFHPYFPENANTRGADVVIHSIHKTLPSLTQTALIHMNGVYADRERIKKYLRMIQTSSPSYVLMSGIDACVSLLESDKRIDLFDNYVKLLSKTRKRLRELKHLHFIDLKDQDFSKILISVKGTKYSGRQLYFRLLEGYHLQMEMAAGSYVLAMTSVADTEEGFTRLVKALMEIDKELGEGDIFCDTKQTGSGNTNDSVYIEQIENQQEPIKEMSHEKESEFALPRLERIYTSAEVEKLAHESYIAQIDKKTDTAQIVSLPWKQCAGLVSVEYVYLYPPGIPLIVPGEKISEEVVRLIEKYKKMGFQIEGIKKDEYMEGTFGRKKG